MPKDETVFEFKEAGLKLDVTTWVPRFMQSVKGLNSLKLRNIFVAHASHIFK